MWRKKISETCYDKTVLINPKFSDKVSRMEIFGPVVNIYSYDNLEKQLKLQMTLMYLFKHRFFQMNIDETMNFYEKD